jgi:hypothetical protein
LKEGKEIDNETIAGMENESKSKIKTLTDP